MRVRESYPGNTGFPAGFKGTVEAGCSEFKITLIGSINDFFPSGYNRHLVIGVEKAERLIFQGTFCTSVIK